MGTEIDYFFECPEKDIHLNTFIGKQISLKWNGRIECSKCLKQTDKSFGQGFCYSCFISAPEASPCILHPELCEAHLGKGRDLPESSCPPPKFAPLIPLNRRSER
mgnify:CR=1 FL=1